MTEAYEIADAIMAHMITAELPTDMEGARAIVRKQMPGESVTVIDNTAWALLQRAQARHGRHPNAYLRAQAVYTPGNVRFTDATEADYDEALAVMPPAARGPNGFLMGEAYTHTDTGEPVYYGFFRWPAGHYSCALLTERQFRNMGS